MSTVQYRYCLGALSRAVRDVLLVAHGYFCRVIPDPVLLFSHFFSVAFYSLWVMFTHVRPISSPGSEKPEYAAPRLDEYPLLCLKAIRVVSCCSLVPDDGTKVEPATVLDCMRRLWAFGVDGNSVVVTGDCIYHACCGPCFRYLELGILHSLLRRDIYSYSPNLDAQHLMAVIEQEIKVINNKP